MISSYFPLFSNVFMAQMRISPWRCGRCTRKGPKVVGPGGKLACDQSPCWCKQVVYNLVGGFNPSEKY
jgi:hypothetical protein